jgi:fructuronate reductase
VRTEPFAQWVIEDGVVGPAADLAAAGVQITSDLAPWERAKLRLLNGAHSSMAYLGGLAGIVTVDQFVAQPWGHQFVQLLWDEVEPTLKPPPELEVTQYRRELMERFANSALAHRLRQIAMDGSQKLPQRLLASAVDLLARDREPDAVALTVAAWMRWQAGRDDAGASFDVDDPLASTTARLTRNSHDEAERARALLSIDSIFPEKLRTDERFVQLVTAHLEALNRNGAAATVEQFVARSAR